jgi:hypothetical protein
MKNIEMIGICNHCAYHKTIYYANGSTGIGCMAYNMKSDYPVNISRMARCPLGKDEKK